MYAVARFAVPCVFAALGLMSAGARADTVFCISNSGNGRAQFDTAMRYWTRAVNETVYVHMERGTYSIIPNQSAYLPGVGTGYEQDGGDYGGDGNASLHMVGGFSVGDNCKTRIVDADSTVIKGDYSGGARVFELMPTQGSVLIDGIRFEVPSGVMVTARGAAVTLRNVVVTGVSDTSSVNQFGAALLFKSFSTGPSGNAYRLENALIYGNAVDGLLTYDDYDDDTLQIVNSTIVNNAGYGINIGGVGANTFKVAAHLAAYNLIVRGNAQDIAVASGSTTPVVVNSDFHSVAGSVIGNGNLDADAKFVDAANGNFDLATTSPAINAGVAEQGVPGGYADTDIQGRQRIIGSRIDLGAFESTVNDVASQVVTSPVDGTSGATLRNAILAANLNANPTTISFDIAGGTCPQVINLASVLPDITSDVTIDGYTQPMSAQNTLAPGYNGNLCVVLRGAGAGVDHGFLTSGGGRLTVRGIEFENFNNAAIRLTAGSGHVVTGNGFSAMPGSTANKVGVSLEGTAKASQIGNLPFGDRNVFDQATDSAIKFTNNGNGGHFIEGNYLGFDFDGTLWSGSGNHNGISATNSASNTISYNYIGGVSNNAIRLSGATTSANAITYNGIGMAPSGNVAAPNGIDACSPLCIDAPGTVDITSGAHDNFVGATDCTSSPKAAVGSGNAIANNKGPGVWIETTAGAGNRICGNNEIHDNSGFLAIDVGAQNATANDSGDVDGGGNGQQNYPQLSKALRLSPNVVRLSGLLLTQSPGPAQGYRLDLYWTDTCVAGDASGPRGELKRYIGFFNLFTDGSAFVVPFSNLNIGAAAQIPSSGYLTATATDSAGDSSEPSPCFALDNDYIFADAF